MSSSYIFDNKFLYIQYSVVFLSVLCIRYRRDGGDIGDFLPLSGEMSE